MANIQTQPRLTANSQPRCTCDQTIRLLTEGEKLWEGNIGDQSKDIMLRLQRPTQAAVAWRVRITAETDLPPDLESQVSTRDPRVPTIGFERLIVVPEDDVITRLDMITKLLWHA